MMTLKFVSGSILTAAGIWAQAVWADGFRNPPDTAAGLSQSGNNTVWVDDASAVFNNPANLVDVPSREVQLSSLVGYSHADYHNALSRTETVMVWPSMTGTLVQVAETTKGAGTCCADKPVPCSVPRILFGSHSTFGSSLRMRGMTLPMMSMALTPG